MGRIVVRCTSCGHPHLAVDVWELDDEECARYARCSRCDGPHGFVPGDLDVDELEQPLSVCLAPHLTCTPEGSTSSLASFEASRPASADGYPGSVARGLRAREDWIRQGILVQTNEFAAACGLTVETLLARRAAGDVFSVHVDDNDWWPAELLKLAPTDARDLCQHLAFADESSKLVFLMRRHGALGGRTVVQASAEGQMGDVLRLAKAWSSS